MWYLKIPHFNWDWKATLYLLLQVSGLPERRRSISNPSASLTERTTSPLHSKNGGREYFDEATGKFKRWPVGQKEPGEVVRRVRVRGRNGEEGNRRVNKVLKRRKKYKKLAKSRLPKTDEKSGNSKEEAEGAYPRLTPLKSKYMTSDTIRMHMSRSEEEEERQVVKESRHTVAPVHYSRKPSSAKLVNMKSKNPPKRMEVGEVEGREAVYDSFDNPEQVLLTSGYHQQLSVKAPNYDYTIGDTRNSPSADTNPFGNHQFFPTPQPSFSHIQNPYSDPRQWGAFAPANPSYPSPTSNGVYSPTNQNGAYPPATNGAAYGTPDYSAYPGIYFPPSSNSDTNTNLVSSSYDFTIGDSQAPHTNPLLQFLGGSSGAATPHPKTTTTSPPRQRPATTRAPESGRSHTTRKSPTVGRKFPHFPSLEVDNYVSSDYSLRRTRANQAVRHTSPAPSHYQTTTSPSYYSGRQTTSSRQGGFYHQRTTSSQPMPVSTVAPAQFHHPFHKTARSYSNATPSRRPNGQVKSYEKEKTKTGFSGNSNNPGLFSAWGQKMGKEEQEQRQPDTTLRPTTIKIPSRDITNAHPSAGSEPFQTNNYRPPIPAYPGLYKTYAPTDYTYSPASHQESPTERSYAANSYKKTPPFSQPLTRGPLRQELGTPETQAMRQMAMKEKTAQFTSSRLGPLKPYQPALTFLSPEPSKSPPATSYQSVMKHYQPYDLEQTYPQKKANSYTTTDKPNPFLQSPAKVHQEAENARQDNRRPRHPTQIQPYYPEPVSFFQGDTFADTRYQLVLMQACKLHGLRLGLKGYVVKRNHLYAFCQLARLV